MVGPITPRTYCFEFRMSPLFLKAPEGDLLCQLEVLQLLQAPHLGESYVQRFLGSRDEVLNGISWRPTLRF